MGCLGFIALLGCLNALAARPRTRGNDIDKSAVVDHVILSVLENYYDPTRIDSLSMFKAVLDTLQKAVAEMRILYDEDNKKATVDILGKQLAIDIESLTSPWQLSRSIQTVFRFLAENLPRKEYDLSDLTYAAANGMLSRLDPHSNALPPDLYENLRMDTAGEFGGLGIRITTDRRPPCLGRLTVVDVFDDTPAARAGIRKGDQIMRIDGESTVNITTSEAAKRLRGRPGSSLRLEIRRPDGQTRKINVRRETIPIKSVTWKLLKDKVGYISLNQFQNNSADEVAAALAGLNKAGMKGLVLDLRNNPGGLLDVAIKITDKFLDSGTIVATAGRQGKNKASIRNATANNTEAPYPLAVLIDSTSASAAEIVAGALGNHGRALLIGETTFGKGSVQMVQPLPGGGALKLTSAQYLTPGDISIQAVGVSPDVSFVSYTIDKKELDFGRVGPSFSEADLEGHLDRPTTRIRSDKKDTLSATLVIPPADRRVDQERFERCFIDDEDQYSFQDRYELELARRIIASFNGKPSETLLGHASQLIAADNQKHQQTIRRELQKLGVRWGSAQPSAKNEVPVPKPDPRVTAAAKLIGPIRPGKSFKIKVTVKNGSPEPITRLKAVTKSDNHLLDQLDFIFGEIKPGRRRSWVSEIELPSAASARIDTVTVTFTGDAGPVPKPIDVTVQVPKTPISRLAYTWQFEDLTNKNGFIEPGEDVMMHVTVKNMGPGTTVEAHADLSAKPGVDIVRGRFDLGQLKPGDSVDGVFLLRVSERFLQKQAELNLTVSNFFRDRLLTFQTLLNREIDLPVSPPSPRPEPASGTITVKKEDGAILRESPSIKGRQVAVAVPKASFAVNGAKADFFRVALTKQRHAWIQKSDTIPGGAARPKYKADLRQPPLLSVDGEVVRRVQKETVNIRGRAEHPDRIRDVMVFVGDRKLLYQPSQDGKPKGQLVFSVDVPLEEGANFVTIVARYDDKTMSALPVFIRRDGTGTAKQKTGTDN